MRLAILIVFAVGAVSALPASLTVPNDDAQRAVQEYLETIEMAINHLVELSGDLHKTLRSKRAAWWKPQLNKNKPQGSTPQRQTIVGDDSITVVSSDASPGPVGGVTPTTTYRPVTSGGGGGGDDSIVVEAADPGSVSGGVGGGVTSGTTTSTTTGSNKPGKPGWLHTLGSVAGMGSLAAIGLGAGALSELTQGAGPIADLLGVSGVGVNLPGAQVFQGIGTANNAVKQVINMDRMKCTNRLACEFMANRGIFNTSSIIPMSSNPAVDLTNPSSLRTVLGVLQLLRLHETGVYPHVEAGLWGAAHRDPSRCLTQFSNCPSTSEAFISELNSTPGGVTGAFTSAVQAIRKIIPGSDGLSDDGLLASLGLGGSAASGGFGSLLGNFGQQGQAGGLGGQFGGQQFLNNPLSLNSQGSLGNLDAATLASLGLGGNGLNGLGGTPFDNRFGNQFAGLNGLNAAGLGNQQFGVGQLGANQFGSLGASSNNKFSTAQLGSQIAQLFGGGSNKLTAAQLGSNQFTAAQLGNQFGGQFANGQFAGQLGNQFTAGQLAGTQFAGLGTSNQFSTAPLAGTQFAGLGAANQFGNQFGGQLVGSQYGGQQFYGAQLPSTQFAGTLGNQFTGQQGFASGQFGGNGLFRTGQRQETQSSSEQPSKLKNWKWNE